MAQLSRPYQILLGAVVVFGLIWAVALRGHSSNPSEPSASSSQPASSSSQSASTAGAAANGSSGGNPAAPTSVYHGSAPGVEGLTRAIAKAHGVVGESQRNVQTQESNSHALESQQSTTSTVTPAGTKVTQSVTVTHKTGSTPVKTTVKTVHTTTSTAHGKTVTHSTTTSTHTAAASAPTVTKVHRVIAPTVRTPLNSHRAPRSSSKPSGTSNPQEVVVEHELAQGKTVMLFFWNPKSSVDRIDQTEASRLAAHSKGTVTLHMALANQVGEFGTITEVVHVYQTPTILIVNKHGLVSTLSGLTDVFALEQALQEARGATG